MKQSFFLLALLCSTLAHSGSRIGGNVNISAIVQGSMVANNATNYVGVVAGNTSVGGSVNINAVVTNSIITGENGETKIACVDEDTAGSVNITVVVSSVVNQGGGDVKIGCSD